MHSTFSLCAKISLFCSMEIVKNGFGQQAVKT
jgi:hypothetical protein